MTHFDLPSLDTLLAIYANERNLRSQANDTVS
jgi:hypothetical protein